MGTKYWILKSLCFCLLFPVMQVGGQTNFLASLDGSQEVGPNGSVATGTAVFVLNAAQDQLTIDLTITSLDLDGLQTPDVDVVVDENFLLVVRGDLNGDGNRDLLDLALFSDTWLAPCP